MPKLLAERRRISEDVVHHVLQAFFEGRLRPGARIDIDEMADELGVSRSPVREALVILERDGFVTTRYHRGVFVENFDAEALVDFFEVYGNLSALAVRRLAEARDPVVLAELRTALKRVQDAPDDGVEEAVRDLLWLQHRTGGTKALQNQLNRFWGFAQASAGRDRTKMIKGQAGVVRAIAAGDADRAARLRIADFIATGKDLTQRLDL